MTNSATSVEQKMHFIYSDLGRNIILENNCKLNPDNNSKFFKSYETTGSVRIKKKGGGDPT